MRRATELMIIAIEKEITHRERIAVRAKKRVEECLGASKELLAIHNEAVELHNSDATLETKITGIEDLKVRETNARKLMSRDISKETDREIETESDVSELRRELASIKFRQNTEGK